MFRQLQVAGICSIALFASQLAFGAAPRISWKTIVTPNFRVHYHEGLDDLAVQVSNLAEGALPELSRILGNRPQTPIHLVITDDMDSPQGFAEVLPENVITLFPAVPPPTSELGDFDDFMRLLLIHEMVHVVHLDTIGGIPRAFNRLFGKQWSPNLIQPRWVVEGIAVNLESHFTSGGRIRSNLIDMIMRAQIISDVFPPIDELSNVNRRFLFGSFPWIFGGRLMDFIGRRYGEDAIAQMSRDYGTRPLPYALNLITERAVHKPMVDVYDEWEAWERQKANAVLDRVRAEGVVTGEHLPREAAVVREVNVSSRGDVAFIEEPRDGDTELVVLAPDLQTERLRVRTDSGASAFTHDAEHLVATIADSHERAYFFDDLEIIEIDTGRRTRRTFGARLSDPDVARDGTIAAVRQAAGRTWIVTLPFLEGEPIERYLPEYGRQVSSPEFSPDGEWLAFSELDPSGARNLMKLDLSSGSVERLTEGMAHDIDPCWSPDGSSIYFTSDRGGVFNAYRLELATRSLAKITNVETGIFEPSISPDGTHLYFALFHAFGYDLQRIPVTEGREPDPPLVRPLATSSAAVSVYPVEEYSPWETLLPKAWLPTTGSDGVGSTFGISVVQADALRQHAYSFGLHYGIESERLGYSASYYNSMLVTPISVSSSLVATTRPGSFAPSTPEQDRLESIWRFAVGFSVPLGAWDTGHALSFAYSAELRRGLTLFDEDPFQTAPPLDPNLTLSAISLGWNFSNVRGFAESISSAAGHSFSVNVRFNDPVIGSDLRVIEIVGRWYWYLTLPWLEHHVLATRVTAGGSVGDARGRGVFVLGGLPVRNILQDVIDGIGVGSEVIRGYEQAAFRGTSYYLLNVEYRLPIVYVGWGIQTVPFFIDRLSAAVFTDAGNAPIGTLHIEDTKVGVGAELRLDLELGYVVGYTLRFGYARGLLGEEAIHNVYLVLGGVY